ncbi:uncharacterized protein LOC130999044 isoform X2 [Salvia miltiorrhiza]|uniref:uncharacterized protein LOC130999044 isoform X2 n=1 Tax=Salvia miltiorrhiza TaxID=226208 RepID=UPI0025ABB8F4|nr:uncharacterized protein LOC130999044 isoform X2 [Salvia miltiorrhiza]
MLRRTGKMLKALVSFAATTILFHPKARQKGCLGALDDTYISVLVPNIDKARYRTRKGQIATNMLGVCDRNMKFVYALPGWEGSAADSRVLRDAVNRRHGFRVPRGNYYLVDCGYANSEGFLAPYKGVRYHLKEWGPTNSRPQNAEELFNLQHAKAQNVIERAFGIIKMRWAALRSTTYYPIKVQVRLIMACVLLENFIRSNMAVDPIEQQYDLLLQDLENTNDEQEDFVDTIESSQWWNADRDVLAQTMWQQYLHAMN